MNRLSGSVLLIVALTVVVDAAETAVPRRVVVTVRVFDQIGVAGDDLRDAMAEAVSILHAVGLDLVWIGCFGGDDDPLGCQRPLRPGELIVRLGAAPSIPVDRMVQMGYALVVPTGSPGLYATVFEDLVRTVARRAAVDDRRLLGRAIAHEIGHLLLNDNQHASRGLMRARWSRAELRSNTPSDWTFGDDEASRMRTALAARID